MKRELAEEYIKSRLTFDACEYSLEFKLLYQTNRHPQINLTDIIKMAFDDSTMAYFNPFLKICLKLKKIMFCVFTSLLIENLDLYQNLLTASIFRIQIFQQPFNRL